MPNKYSHGAVLAQYSSRGWIDLANDDYVGYTHHVDSHRHQSGSTTKRADLIREQSGGTKFSDGSYIRPHTRKQELKQEQPTRHVIIDEEVNHEKKQLPEETKSNALPQQESRSTRGKQDTDRPQMTIRQDSAHNQRLRPIEHRRQVSREDVRPKTHGADRPRTTVRLNSGIGETSQGRGDRRMGTNEKALQTPPIFDTASPIHLESARSQRSALMDYWDTADYDRKESKSSLAGRPQLFRIGSANSQTSRELSDRHNGGGEDLRPHTRGRERPPTMIRLDGPATEMSGDVDIQRNAHSQSMQLKTEKMERLQKERLARANTPRSRATNDDQKAGHQEPRPVKEAVQEEGEDKRKKLPQQHQPNGNPIVGLPTPPASVRAPSAPPDTPGGLRTGLSNRDEVEPMPRSRGSSLARLRQEDSRASIMTQIFNPEPSKSTNQQSTTSSTWTPRPVPPPTDLPDSVEDISDPEDNGVMADEEDLPSPQPKPQRYQVPLMTANKKSVKCPSFVTQPTLKPQPQTQPYPHSQSHPTHHPLASFTSASIAETTPIANVPHSHASDLDTNAVPGPLSPKASSLFSQDLEPFSDFSDFDSLNGDDTFSNFSDEPNTSTFQYGPFTAGSGPSTSSTARTNFPIYGTISTSRNTPAHPPSSSKTPSGAHQLRKRPNLPTILSRSSQRQVPTTTPTSSALHTQQETAGEDDEEEYAVAPAPGIPRVAPSSRQTHTQIPPPPQPKPSSSTSSSSSHPPRPRPPLAIPMPSTSTSKTTTSKSSSSLSSSLSEKIRLQLQLQLQHTRPTPPTSSSTSDPRRPSYTKNIESLLGPLSGPIPTLDLDLDLLPTPTAAAFAAATTAGTRSFSSSTSTEIRSANDETNQRRDGTGIGHPLLKKFFDGGLEYEGS